MLDSGKVHVVDLLRMGPDDRGSLYEIIRDDRPDMVPAGTRIAQVYAVHDPVRGTIRAFHKHDVMLDFFHIAAGSAKFIFADDDAIDGRLGYCQSVVLSALKPQMIVVPPGIWHGWKSLEDNTLLVSAASEVYNKECPDEHRVHWDVMGKGVWEKVFR